jgi:hypothetical protein
MLVGAIAITAIVVGCGGGDSSNSAANNTDVPEASSPDATDKTPPADKEVFIRSASAACDMARKGAFERIGAYKKKHSSEQLSKVALTEAALRAVLLSTIEAEIKGIHALDPPAEDKKELNTIIDEIKTTFDKAKADKTLSYAEIEESFSGSDKKLKAYGLSDCAKHE